MTDLDGYEVVRRGAAGGMPQLTARQLFHRRVGNAGAWVATIVALLAIFSFMESPGWLLSLVIVIGVYYGSRFLVFVALLRDARSPNGWSGWRTNEALAQGIVRQRE